MTGEPDTDREIGEAERVAREHLRIFADGDVAAIAGNVSADDWNHRSADEPLAARQRGPAGFECTVRWAQRGMADLRFEVHDVAFDGNLLALHVTMHGRQHGPFVIYDSPDGRVTDVFPSTGRTFAARQTHWITVVDGRVTEHDAVRDDLGMAKQLGWIPPTPAYLTRMALAKRKERRAGLPSRGGQTGRSA